ncbi:PREDICTED: leucine-rich repeat flightless-interacting protein 1 isoform X12 [Capra hircus]|uniref:leucine-rich repeat flightless-interacting protein 1 isoform X12 n=1 Tax=Capra hircus TaxID=9925 RepID=UPI0008475D62|nr:PREDICTED: leucine-rich repeat flightless-interacting protein 1 isoform X12 [Capra hircus]
MDMGTQGSGRKRLPNRERLTAEDDALNQIAREAEARLAAKRAARAEAREIRMKELERQQKEIYQVQKKYYGLDTKWGDIEQWMEDSERYSHRSRRNTSASDEDERMSVGSRGSLRSQPDLEYGGPYAWTNGYDGDLYGSQSLSRRSGRNSSYSGDGRFSTLSSSREDTLGLSCSDLGLRSLGLAPKPLSAQNGNRPSYLYSAARPAGSNLASVSDESSLGGARRGGACGSQALGGQASELSGHFKSSSRASSRASSARASPVVEERPEKDFTEKGSRSLPGLSAATLASLGGTSSRRGSGDTSISIDTEASIREIKELNELKDQIQDVEGKYMQGLKEMKDSLAEVEEKYKKAMVSNAQLDNEKTNFMYQVDTLKDMLLELEEQLAESRRQYEEKSKEFEREKHAHSILQFQFAEVKEALKQREEMLEKHGIILNSEIATNGETPDTLNSIASQGSTKMTKEELSALTATGDGALGRANEVEVKNEMVEREGKRAVLQSTEQRQHKEDPGESCADPEASHPGDSAEDQSASADGAPSPGTLVNSESEGEAQSRILEAASFPADTQQVESSEVIDREPVGEIPDPGIGQGSGNALDIENQREESAKEQEKGKQEDLEANLEEMSTKPCQESAPPQISEAGREGSADPSKQSGSPTKAEPEAGLTGLGAQGGTAASSPLSSTDDPGSHHEKCLVDALEGSDPSAGQDVEKELANQEVAEPREAPVQSTEAGGENKEEEEDEGRNLREEKPIEPEVQTSPRSPEAESSPQEVTDPRVEDAESEPLDVKDPNEENDQRGEAPDSSQKKTKNKKKKNKKKKSPAPVEIKDVQNELTFQNPGLSEVKEEQEKDTDEKPVVDAQNEVTENPNQNSVAESSENSDGPENPKVELDGKLDQDDAAVNTKAGGDTLDFEDNMIQSSGTSNKELDEGAVKDEAEGDDSAPSSPPGPENIEVPSSAPLEDGSPAKDINDASQTESAEGHVTSENLGQTVREFSDSIDLENNGLAAADEVGDFNSESKEEKTGGTGKGRSKEDCTMS